MHGSPRRAGFALGVALLMGLFAAPLAAQQTTGKIEGRVFDAQSGQPLAGAQVTVVGTTLGNITNADGYYFVNNVPAGLHDIQAQYIGYQTVTVQDQRVLAGQTFTVDFRLPQTAVALEAITVQGETNPLVPRDQVLTKAVVTGDVAQAIPVENVRAVVTLQPGVVETGDHRGQVIRGGRPGEAAVYVDGVLVRNFNAGQQSGITLQTNSVEEIDVLVGGYGAEYGQAQSGVINLVSRGGGTDFSGNVGIETDQHGIGNTFGYTRAEANVSGPILGEKLGFSLGVTAIGEEDARPTFSGADAGTITARLSDDRTVTVPIAPTRFFRETGEVETRVIGEDTVFLRGYEELTDLEGRKPWNNGDQYNVNLTFRGSPVTGTRYNLGATVSRDQRRFYSVTWPFRPQSQPARRDKSYLIRGGLEQQLFQRADQGAVVRVNLGYQSDHSIQGFLGETLADTAAVRDDQKWPMFGDFLGFTFDDFQFPFEDSFTLERYMARVDSMRADPSLNYLFPFEALGFTPSEASEQFSARGTPDNPFGLNDIFGSGFTGFAQRREKTFSVNAHLDWQANRVNRIGIGAEIYKKDIENVGSSSSFASALSTVSTTAPTFQNVYEASPVIAGFYAKDRLDLGEIVVELGARVDMFDSDVQYPEIPGFFLPVTVQGQTIQPKFIEQERQWQFSPRLGVGFPVTENTQFRLSYGHFTQVPALHHLFGGVTGDLNKTNPNAVFGRPIEFGRTIGYEAGFTHSFNENTVVDISGYNREKQGDVAYRTGLVDLPGKGPTTVRFLTNADFGYSRGVDTRLTRRFSNAFSMQLSYSYLTSRSTGSDPNTYLTTIGRQTDPVTGEPVPPPQSTFPTDFDQAHTISAAGTLNVPTDYAMDSRWANLLFRDIHATLAFQARSGLPYTRTNTEGATSAINGPDPRFIEPVNASRLPWSYISNARVGRNFNLAGNALTLYVDGRNLLNAKNQNEVFSATGSTSNPGSTYLQSAYRGTNRDFGGDLVIADVPNAQARVYLERREALFSDGEPDGILTEAEAARSAMQSFVTGGFGSDLGVFLPYFLGQPRQFRLGLEWHF